MDQRLRRGSKAGRLLLFGLCCGKYNLINGSARKAAVVRACLMLEEAKGPTLKERYRGR